MEYRYKNGQAVRVRSDLTDNYKEYFMRSGPRANIQWEPATIDMCNLRGQIVHIKELNELIGDYTVEEDKDGWEWTDEMFELIEEDECFCESLL
jgi:hypothetical protein